MYDYDTSIGEGSHGVVYRAFEISTGNVHALKLPKNEEGKDGIIREIDNQEEIRKWDLDEDFPIAMAKCFSKENPWISYEILDVSLCDYSLERFLSFDTLRSLGRDILTALKIIHEKGFVIHDIKPDNVMITCTDRPRAKIIDLGMMSQPDELQDLGTLAYMSPESLIVGLVGSDNFQVDTQADMWSFAVTLYSIRTRSFLFHDNGGTATRSFILRQMTNQLADDIDTSTSLTEAQIQLATAFMPDSVRDGVRVYTLANRFICHPGREYDDCMMFRDLLLKLLRFSPKDRLSAKEALEHPFFN